MKGLLRVMVLAAGLAVFGWFIHRAGLGEIWGSLTRLGWCAPLVAAPLGVVYLAETWGWRMAFGPHYPAGLKFRSLYRVRLCGEAVNNVIPSGTVVGEATKVYLLHKRGVHPGDAAAGTIVGRTVQTLMQVTFIAVSSMAFMRVAGDKPGVAPAMGVVLAGSLGLVLGLFFLQAHGLFASAFTLARWLRLPVGKLAARAERLDQIDAQVRHFYEVDRKHFLGCAGSYLSAWMLDTLDSFLVAWLLGMPMAWLQALAIEAFIGVARILGFLTPGSLGVQETGITLVCSLAGLPPEFGPAYAIIRRGRDACYAALGWFFLYLEESSLSAFREHMREETGRTL